jgi:hypothetical protein
MVDSLGLIDAQQFYDCGTDGRLAAKNGARQASIEAIFLRGRDIRRSGQILLAGLLAASRRR